MMRSLAIAAALLLFDVAPALTHRVDEYLEAATIMVAKGRVRLDLRLAPGIAVAPTVLDSIDTDRDGAVSAPEEQAYAGRVRDDLRLTIDGERLPLCLVSLLFPRVDELKDGVGEIHLAFEGDLPAGGRYRHVAFENRHRPRIAAYLVNGLVPEDDAIHITGQTRNYIQSIYELTYEQLPAEATTVQLGTVFKWGALLSLLGLLVTRGLLAFSR